MAVAARTPEPLVTQPTVGTGTTPTATSGVVPTTVPPTTVAPTTAVPAPTTAVPAPTTEPPTTASSTAEAPTTTTEAPTTTVAATTVPPPSTRPPRVEADVAQVTMTSVPADVLLATGESTLQPGTNPINGRRSLERAAGRADFGCTVDPDAPRACLLGTLDALGFDVGGPDEATRARRLRQSVAAVQLDAGFRATGIADRALFDYLGVWPGTDTLAAAEVRRLGASAEGRPIVARRYGSGPRVVLVVGQTHGDEEAGLRVVHRLARQVVPAGVTLWVVPTMNPDGLARDTRFLRNGLDPNRNSPGEPEQRAVQDFAEQVRPVLAVYYHQNYAWIGGSGASMEPAARYHQITALGALYRSGDCALGFLWCPVDDTVGSSSILVELPDVVPPADVHLHVTAMLTVAAG